MFGRVMKSSMVNSVFPKLPFKNIKFGQHFRNKIRRNSLTVSAPGNSSKLLNSLDSEAAGILMFTINPSKYVNGTEEINIARLAIKMPIGREDSEAAA